VSNGGAFYATKQSTGNFAGDCFARKTTGLLRNFFSRGWCAKAHPTVSARKKRALGAVEILAMTWNIFG
jgi:hypothetical protein